MEGQGTSDNVKGKRQDKGQGERLRTRVKDKVYGEIVMTRKKRKVRKTGKGKMQDKGE